MGLRRTRMAWIVGWPMLTSLLEKWSAVRREPALGLLTGVVILGTFIADALTPLGVVPSALYAVAILVAREWRGSRGVVPVTFLVIGLTVLAHWVLPAGPILVDLINRLVAVMMLSLVGMMCLRLERKEEAHRLAEEAREEYEIKLSSLVQSAADAIILADSDGNIVSWNKAANNIFGYKEKEVVGRPLTLLIPERYRDAHRKGLERMRSSGESRLIGKAVELHGLRKDGSEFPLELSLAAWKTKDAAFYSGIIRDITERKQVEGRLAAQYAVTRVLAESVTLDEATPKILQAVCESAGWELGAIWNVDGEANVLRSVDIWHAPAVNVPEFEAVTKRITFQPGVGLPGRVWASGKPAWITDVVQDANFPRFAIARKTGLHGAFAFPIMFGGEVTGVIEFFSREVRRPDEPLLRMMGALGSQIGQFLLRKRGEKERERLLVQLQDAVANIKTLRGLLPICATCKKIRDDKGDWNRMEDYIKDRSEAHFTHGICPECARKIHPEWDEV